MLSLRHCIATALLALSLPAAAVKAPAQPATPTWIERSNGYAQIMLKVFGEFGPEGAAQLGLTGYDEGIFDNRADVNARLRAAIIKAKAELVAKRSSESDAQVRQDLDIMIAAADLAVESQDLNEKLVVPFTDIGQGIFQGEFALLQDEVAPKRRGAALVRLKRYTGLESGYTPVTELAKARFNEAAAKSQVIGPFKGEVEQALANTGQYVDGIRKLYTKYKIGGADKALATLETQLKDYEAWARATVLPRSRTDFRLPAELYANNLKNVGLDIAPEALVHKAQLAYSEIRNEMRTLAPLIAKQRGLTVTDYRDVIRELKKEQLTREQVEPAYAEVISKIEEIIRRERIVTLPQRAMLMRVASDAETAAQPAPHMDAPPLIGNHGERGTFVLTAGNPSSTDGKAAGYDDFSHRASTWTLTAHEGRPGHELQFSAMVERGVSLARTVFAFNSVNVEGWALYAEAETKPYEPLEGQLFALQARLQRAARAILDPMLNLGQITPERATEVLTQEVMLSPAMAKQEVDRYTFRAPGQATSYFYGYTRLMELRTETEIALGKKFDRMAFNDFVISQGLLPPELVAQAVRTEFVPAQMKK
ncbi:MAG: DUF885 domain-containing protein [Tahibacter sp.]